MNSTWHVICWLLWRKFKQKLKQYLSYGSLGYPKAEHTSARLAEKRHWKSHVRTPINRLNSSRNTDPVLSLLSASVRSAVKRSRQTETPDGWTLVTVRRTLPDVASHITICPRTWPTSSRLESAFTLTNNMHGIVRSTQDIADLVSHLCVASLLFFILLLLRFYATFLYCSVHSVCLVLCVRLYNK